MSLPKARQAASQPRRRICRLCYNLDPRGHTSTVYHTESKKGATASLTLVLDALALQRTKAPSDGGCRFCAVLIRALDAFFEGWRRCRSRVTLDIKEKGSIKVGVDGEEWKGELVEIHAGSASRVPWPTLGVAHGIPSHSGSDDTFDFARRCIQDCLTNPRHITCQSPSKSTATTPKRLLDVGRVTAPIRLIDTQGKSFQYATLSHCWGSGPVFSATKSNWQKLSSNIPFDKLPPLFQDAIIITRQLGLRYVWIDSLCIIQDSIRDWETESSKMSGIYESSYVTIAATESGDGNTHCLLERQKPVRIGYVNTTGKEFVLRARKVQDHHPHNDVQAPARPMGPLTTRAWALQEHVLSTRILHYTSTELLFECRTSFRCECSPSRKSYPTTPALISKAVARKSKNNEAVWDAWQHLVEEYSKRSLTVSNDKLPAISGIASKIKEATGSAYLAGLWKDNLASDLLWSSTPAAQAVSTFLLANHRAPSFSWASIDTAVSYYVPEEEERATFMSTAALKSSTIALAGLNPLGAVSNSALRLRGPCITVTLTSQPKEASWEYSLLIKGTSAIRISHDCMLMDVDDTVRRAQLGCIPVAFKAPVLCLSVARYDGWISGLVLGKSERVPDAWERLGIFSAGSEGMMRTEIKDVTLV